jgi:hypothetical protein
MTHDVFLRVSTPLRNPLTTLRLLPRPKRPPRQFFSRYVKERFRILDIQIIIYASHPSIFAFLDAPTY